MAVERIQPMHTFRAKITILIILCMLFAGAVNNLLVYRYALDAQFDSLRDELKVIAQTSALAIDSAALEQIPLDPEGADTAQYKAVYEKLKKIQKLNAPIKYIYALKKTGKDGIWQFIVDVDPIAGDNKPAAKPGDRYDASRFPEMLNGYYAPSADRKLEKDEWGVTLSGYAPVLGSDGKTLGMVGVDVSAADVFTMQNAVRIRAAVVLLLGIILSIVAGFLLSKKITNRINRLVAGTRHVASGDLYYRIKVEGSDEISELASSFNQMAVKLSKSRRELLSYFYRVVQALVRIMEARDHYTKGHSERVTEYAAEIGAKMGLSSDKIEMLREVTLLHDIGKLGIQESILNKKEKLTEEEWESIKRHPIIGEDILRPVLLTKEMLEIVRGHHERYDGKGYPDKLSGESINIFSAIVSVADSYDAMTSARAYRPALPKEKAIEELIKNKGTQFNPKAVDAFIEVLNEG